MSHRRIVAEDPEWNVAPVSALSALCVAVLVGSFPAFPVLDRVPTKHRQAVCSAIAIDADLHRAALLVPDECYWKRRAAKRFSLANVNHFQGSWKRLFFELHLAELVEAHEPTLSGGFQKIPESLVEAFRICAPYVKALTLRQLRPIAEDDPLDSRHSHLLAKKSDLAELLNVRSIDHLELSSLLPILSGLETLSIYYGVKDCRTEFKWSYFGMTINDSIQLAKLIQLSSSLKSLTIKASGVDDDRCRVICQSLLKNKTMEYLDLSNNKIGYSGSRAVAAVLASPETALSTLKMQNNPFGSEAAFCIGKALMVNKTLHHLDLRLCQIGDENGSKFLGFLKHNSIIKSLDLSGNILGALSASALADLLKHNGKTLRTINISCNKLGLFPATLIANSGTDTTSQTPTNDFIGKMLLEAISVNKVSYSTN